MVIKVGFPGVKMCVTECIYVTFTAQVPVDFTFKTPSSTDLAYRKSGPLMSK